MRYLVSVLVFSCLFSSCGFVRNEEIIDGYHLVAVDIKDDTYLGYKVNDDNYVGLIPSKVISYCYSGQYIFVKQLPYPYEKLTKIYYYIVPVINDTTVVYPEDSIVGPLSESDFKVRLSKMNLKDLEFKEVN